MDQNWRALIVEDDFFIANDLVEGFEPAGITIIGPVPSLAKALDILQNETIDGAVLDINLDGEKVYEVADVLIERGTPLLFVTGYDRPSIPEQYSDVPLLTKPADTGEVIAVLRRIIVR